ncbi:MAG: carboxylate-amine ligase, partial [Pyrinomonadaceae bacterium]|nr:carboxylate-amine ligase [Pyrinomonadaceae bacterium]
MFDQFTLGIEEEFQIVDPVTRELRSHVSEILEEGKLLLGEKIKPEMIQSMIEVGTGVCHNIQEARTDITQLRCIISSLARKKGLEVVAASTHPFSHWGDQEIFDDDRYKFLVQELQMVARSLLIFGLHVHVGIEDREKTIQVMNAARYFLPHVLALTTSSPFWLGHNTGLKSYRSEVFKKFPRTDIPDHFDSYASFQRYVDLLVKMKCIDNGKKIYWDVRPHPFFPTLEFRVCDIPTRVDDTIAIAALFQAIVAKLYKLINQNLGFRLYRRMLIQENKWRAVRYGLQGQMLDLGKQKEVPAVDLIRELLDFVDEVLDDLGSRKEVEHIHTIIERGTSA